MSQLIERAEDYIVEHNVKLTKESRDKLSKYDPETQMKWLVNPLVQYFIEKTINDIRYENSCRGQDPDTQTPTPGPAPAPVRAPSPPRPKTPEEPVFNLFD